MTSPTNAARLQHLKDTAAYEMPQVAHRVTPNTVENEAGTVLYTGGGSLEFALANLTLGPNDFVIVEDGLYPPPGKVSGLGGGTFIARTKHGVEIDVPSGDNALYTPDGGLVRETTFRGFRWNSGRLATWSTLSEKPPYRVNWRDCIIDGGYDHANRTGRDTKWGLNGHRWSGYMADCHVRNHYREHGAYIHTPEDDLLIAGCLFEKNGRTAMQVVGRTTESTGKPGAGYADVEVNIHRSTARNNGLKDGGQAWTFAGVRDILIDGGSESFIGDDRDFRDRYMETHPEIPVFGRGHLVVWDDKGRAGYAENVVLEDVNFKSWPGDGWSPAVQVTASDRLVVRGRVYVEVGYQPTAFLLKYGMAVDTSGLGDYRLAGDIVLTP